MHFILFVYHLYWIYIANRYVSLQIKIKLDKNINIAYYIIDDFFFN